MIYTILFSLILMSVESLIFYKIMNSNMIYKFNPRYRIVVFLLQFGLLSVRYITSEIYSSDSISAFMHVVVVLSLFLISFLFYEGSYLKKIIVPLIFLILLTLSELIVMFIFVFVIRESPTVISTNDFYYQQMALTSKVIAFILVEIYNKRKGFILEFPRRFIKEIIIISSVDLVFTIYVATLWRQSTSSLKISINYIMSIMLCVVFIISVMTIILLYRLAKQAEKEIENSLKLHQIEMENKLNKDMTGIVESLRNLRHDMNAHMGILKGLLQFKQYDELSEYLDSICHELKTANNFLVIDNKVLFVLINSKIAKAVDLGIDFQPIVTIKTINITECDMCALIGNIIENAIEAVEQVDDNKYIFFKMEERDGHCIIYCENTYSVKPIKKGINFVTTKSNKDLHGHGTKIIKSIVEKYNGFIDISVGEVFAVNIVIPSVNHI